MSNCIPSVLSFGALTRKAVSIGISYALHRTIEKPLIQIGRRVAVGVTERRARYAEAVLTPAD